MKHSTLHIILSLLLLVFIGCQRIVEEFFEAQDQQPMTIVSATIEGGNDTRTVLSKGMDGVYYPVWANSDVIGVYSKASGHLEKFAIQSGAGTREALFNGSQMTGDLIGVYPYSDIVDDGYGNGILTLELPSVQHYVEGSFENGAFPMVAVCQSSNLRFKNLCALLHLSLTGTDRLQSIRFHAHGHGLPVSGKATVRMDYATAPELVMDANGSSEVILQCDAVSLSVDEPTDFYLVIPPGTYEGGFDLEISSSSGKMIKTINTDITFSRSQYRSIPTFAFVPESFPVSVPEMVDMGLSVKWATFNLGAVTSEEIGYHYSWGETEPKDDYSWSTYKWCDGSSSTMSKYNGLDSKTVLELKDDAAFMSLGSKWRMPTKAECDELLDPAKTDSEWTTVNGISGRIITSKLTGNCIFLPSTEYWTSNLASGTSAFCLFNIEGGGMRSNSRSNGFLIRPVFDDSYVSECIYYTSTDGKIVTPKADAFGEASMISNTYEGGQGIITFNAPVTEITEKAFSQKTLSSVILPSRLRTIGRYAFEGCSALLSVIIPEGVTAMEPCAFYACYSLPSVTLPSTMTSLPMIPFQYCTSLSSFYGAYASDDHYCLIKDGNLVQYAEGAKNETYIIPSNVTMINYGAFSHNECLKSVIIPTNVTNIRSSAFMNVANLSSVHISSAIEEIEMNAFYYCQSLTSVTIEATKPPKLGSQAFDYTNDCPIYVPAQSVGAYKSADGWSEYAYRIQPNDGSSIPVPDAIDMGLSSGVKWASFNLGASSPEEYGHYYAWGETDPKDNYSWGTYKWCMGSQNTLTKYCRETEWGYNGFTDNKSVLDPVDDAATVHWGSGWRIPTYEEVKELRENTTLSLAEYNGVKVFEVKSIINGNIIYLPIAGYRDESGLHDAVTYRGHYWCSNLISWETDMGSNLCVTNDAPSSFGDNNYYGIYSWAYRYVGYSVRPIYDDSAIPVTGVSIDKNKLVLTVGDETILNAIVLPQNATNKSISWSSSNESVATVSASGVVTGVAPGSAIITATSIDGGKTATCSVTVFGTYTVVTPEAIDLGLPSGIKWASFNLGATKPEEYGDYFAWGETEPYYFCLYPLTLKQEKEAGYDWPSYKWCMGTETTLTKYCTQSDFGYNGFTDGKTVLDSEDDAAHVNLGGKWRIPTIDEQQELFDNCTLEWTTQNGVAGHLVTGTNGKSIFLPAAGVLRFTHLLDPGYGWNYWSSSIDPQSRSFIANGLYFQQFGNPDWEDYLGTGGNYRYNGQSIRPVYDAIAPPTTGDIEGTEEDPWN